MRYYFRHLERCPSLSVISRLIALDLMVKADKDGVMYTRVYGKTKIQIERRSSPSVRKA